MTMSAPPNGARQAWFRGPGWGHKHIVDIKEADHEVAHERGHELVMLPDCACDLPPHALSPPHPRSLARTADDTEADRMNTAVCCCYSDMSELGIRRVCDASKDGHKCLTIAHFEDDLRRKGHAQGRFMWDKLYEMGRPYSTFVEQCPSRKGIGEYRAWP